MFTKTEQFWLDQVSQTPCVICGSWPVEIHHAREGQGMGQRASHFMVAALCSECHRSSLGLHGDRTLLRIHKLSELDLVAKTNEQVVMRLAECV